MEPNLNYYKSWLIFLKEISEYFESEGFLNVRTPILVPTGAMESTLMAFKVEGEGLYLPTSPELALKKLWLSGLSGKLFEISKSFRKEKLGGLHLLEFTVLEFYMAGESFEGLKDLTLELFQRFFKNLEHKRVKLDDAFYTFTGFKLRPNSGKDFLKETLDFHNIKYKETYSWNDLYQMIYLDLIEPLLCKESLLLLENYPPQLAALAKINDKGWAQRFEIFYKGVELGNGYDELFCEKEIQRRWKKENEERVILGFNEHPVDEVLIKLTKETKLKKGVGIAIGLERVFSLISNVENNNIKVWPF